MLCQCIFVHVAYSPCLALAIVTQNAESYGFGRFELSTNLCYGNGINGLAVHQTDRVLVMDNLLFSNGQVPNEAPWRRQPYAGLTLDNAQASAFAPPRP